MGTGECAELNQKLGSLLNHKYVNPHKKTANLMVGTAFLDVFETSLGVNSAPWNKGRGSWGWKWR